MAISILVATTNPGFGELISQILKDTGDYTLYLASSTAEILAVLQKQSVELLVLETDLPDSPTDEIVFEARRATPGLLLILIASEGVSVEKLEKDLSPDGILTKLVYLPDLVSKVEEVIERGKLSLRDLTGSLNPLETDDRKSPSAPLWLKDVNQAAQYLTSLSLGTSARASLITNVDEIWAFAGELPQPAVKELASIVSQHFENGGGSDLARFIRLEQTGSEYMLYSTGLGGPFVLSTVFDTEMPFSKIRAQASNLAMALASPPFEEVEEIAPNDAQYEENDQDDFYEGQNFDLWPLLDDVSQPKPAEWMVRPQREQREGSLLDELLEDTAPDQFSSETMAMAGAFYSPEIESSAQSELDDTVASITRKATADDADDGVDEPQQEEPEDLLMNAEQISVEPVSPSMYNLTYACVLIPRFPEHHLTGDIAQRLTDWITHLCVAFGWRLENLSISPEYVQWMVNVPPNTSPGYLVRIVREHTSRRMFVQFPIMEQDNPAGDFWAPGYLVLGTHQPPPLTLIQEFIQNTRTRQGLLG